MIIRKPTYIDYAQLVFLAAIWGSSFIAIKIAVVEAGALLLVTLRVVIGCIALLPWVLWRGWVWPESGKQWLLLSLVALLNVIAPFFLISWAELYIDSGVAALLMAIGPLLGLIGSHFTTQDDKMTVFKILAVIMGFAGVVLVVGTAVFNKMEQHLMAQGAALLGNGCYIVSGILIRKIDGIPPTRMAGFVLCLASVMLLCVIPFVETPALASLSWTSWASVFYMGILPTAFGYILRYQLIREIGFSAFSLGINLIPVFGVIFSALFLKEVLHGNIILALILIVGGLMIARFGHHRLAV